MTERRRNLFILLFVAGLAIASIVIAVTTPPRKGLDLQGGVELVYEAKPTTNAPVITPDTLNRTIEIMRKRVDPAGTLEPEIQTTGGSQISIALPGFQDPATAQRLVGRTARLYFYDWEPNVIGPDGQPAPEDPDVIGQSGGQYGGPVNGIPLYDAVQRASKRKAVRYDNRAHGDTFYLVDEKAKRVVAGPQTEEQDLFSTEAEEAARQRSQFKVVKVPEGTTILQADLPAAKSGADAGKAPKRQDKWYVLQDDVSLQGSDIKDPAAQTDQRTGEPSVTFNFTSDGRKIWEETTRKIAERGQDQAFGGTGAQHFAIALDNQLITVPQIDPNENPNGISGANGSQITGSFTRASAQELAELLRTGALPVELNLISTSQVSATLGAEALDEAIVAGAVGFAVVALFLLIFYRVLGMLAVSGLVLYSLLFYALVVLIPITLTLPGIAGLILTIGVAADANIVIFERIKEELRSGRSTRSAISAGYKRGLTAIIDANVVTFVVAFILFTLATANVKAFAFVLGVGTLVSFLTAVVYTQALLGVLGRSKFITGRAAFGAGAEKSPRRFDFMGKSKVFFTISGIILAVGAFTIGTKGIPLGIDFESGTRITTGIEKPASEDQVRAFMAEQGYADAKIQKISNDELGNEALQIAIPSLQPSQVAEVRSALDAEYGVGDSFSNTSVGPTFGSQIASTAIVAIIASLLVISAYIALRFEWKYAVPVLIALTHDILIVGGVYAAIGADVTSSTVAALLTILGYSLYDTIIVFDRIRENVPRMPRATYGQVMNQSMSEVLTRSLATSFCTLLPVTALYAFGGETLKDFALALIIGTFSGAYSSIFIAGPVLVHWKEREPLWKRRVQAAKAAHGGVVPAYADAPKVAVGEDQKPKGPVRLSSDQPDQVSEEEFQAMIRDLDIEAQTDARAARGAKTATRPAAPSAPVEEVDPNDPASVRRAEARRRREQRRNRTEGDS